MIKTGVVGFKCFMVHSGIDDFPSVVEEDIMAALTELVKSDRKVPLMFHAELAGPIDACSNLCAGLSQDNYFTFLQSRPDESEFEAVSQVIRLCSEFGKNEVKCHIVHLSSGSAVPLVKLAKEQGVNISCETTYHYLSLAAEEVPLGNTRFKCCPPIRGLTNKEMLWQALRSGVINCAVSDHSPSPIDMKGLDSGNFMKAWGGIASLQLGLNIMWTEAEKRGWSIPELAHKLCLEPAKLVNLDHIKGSIQVGKDADFVIWDPKTQFVVSPQHLQMKNSLVCPYVGTTVKGKVKATILRGEFIYEDNKFKLEQPTGRWVVH